MKPVWALYQTVATARWWRSVAHSLSVSLTCLFGAGLLTTWLPLQAQAGLEAPPESRLTFWGGFVVGLFARTLLNVWGAYQFGAAVYSLITEMRRDLYAKLLQAPQAFHDHQWSANLVATLTTDLGLVQEGLGLVFPALAQHAPTALVVVSVLVWLNPLLTLSLTLMILPGGALLLIAGRRIRWWMWQGQTQLGQIAIAAQESFQGARAIKVLTQEKFFIQRLTTLTETLLNFKLNHLWWRALLTGGLPLVAGLGLLASVSVGYWQWQTNQVTLGDLFTFGAYLLILTSAAAELTQAYTQFASLAGAAERVAELETQLKGWRPPPDALPNVPLRFAGQVTFERVSFTYPGHEQGVSEVSFTVQPGELVALVGPNGAGKSTLMHLLLRLYDPQGGKLWLDQQAPETVALADWRQAIAVVTRDPAIFSISVAENIALGRLGASRLAVESAARAARAHDLIQALPNGYDSVVGEGGVRLSTGQRQRLALARLFLQDPVVIILDEALVSLDRESEEVLIASLTPWLGQRTFFIVSHQPWPAPLAARWSPSRVLRMEAGRLVANETRS